MRHTLLHHPTDNKTRTAQHALRPGETLLCCIDFKILSLETYKSLSSTSSLTPLISASSYSLISAATAVHALFVLLHTLLPSCLFAQIILSLLPPCCTSSLESAPPDLRPSSLHFLHLLYLAVTTRLALTLAGFYI